ncbi:MAG: hypothetical protein ACRD3J_00510 [Thermoanaerobaculia bacterium]
MQRRAEVFVVAALVAVVAVALIATRPRNVFWGPDSGNHFIQLRTVLRSGGFAIDDAPRAAHHFVPYGHHVYSFYSPAFPVATAPFFILFGDLGLFVLPLAGTLTIVILLSRLLDHDYIPMTIAAIFATPLLWYTLVFWEHTLAVALALGAYVLVTRERTVLGGFVAALGVVFREEGYVMIASVAIALLLTRRRVLPFVGGALIALAPLWLINWMTFGHPLGLHAKVYASLGSVQLSNWWVYLFEFTRIPFTMRDTLYTQGFFPAVPLACGIVFVLRRDLLIVTIAAGVLLTPLALNQADFGIIWGPRHFLWLIPMIVVAVAPALRRSRTTAAITLLLIIAGIALQIDGIRLLRTKLQFSAELLKAATSIRKPIISDVFWIPEDLATSRVQLVTRDDELPLSPIVFIGARENRVIAARPLAGRIIRRIHVSCGSDPMLDAMVLDCR